MISGEDFEKMLRVKDLSAIIGCSEKKAYRLVRQPDFPKIVIGGEYFIPADKFRNWINLYTGKTYELI